MKHRGAPLNRIKRQLMADFAVWCDERTTPKTSQNMIEFLIQKGFIQGKAFLDYVDSIKLPIWPQAEDIEPMREGFIPPRAWIGKRDK